MALINMLELSGTVTDSEVANLPHISRITAGDSPDKTDLKETYERNKASERGRQAHSLIVISGS